MPRRLLPIEHRPQEVDAGCLAACVEMILLARGLNISQEELNYLFELTSVGVPLSRLTRLEKYNLQVTIQKMGSLDNLYQSIEQNIPPIIFVRTNQLSYWQEDTQHALLIVGYDETDLLVNDPAFLESPKQINADELMLAWDEFDNTYALIR